MRLAAYSKSQEKRAGLVVADGIVDIGARLPRGPSSVEGIIEHWAELVEELISLQRLPADWALEEVTLHRPIERPGKIMAIGYNYAGHISEVQREPPRDQTWFAKASTAAADPFANVLAPRVSTALDYEGEMALIIGKRCKHVPAEEAGAVILGYCVGNDFSARDWQFKTTQFTLAKSFDTHAPFGPWISIDEVDPGACQLRTYVNGELRQDANTKEMIFPCERLIETLSAAMTLEPGDVIFTGTPAGIGHALKPRRYLSAGDIVRVEIDGLGWIENRIVAEN